MLNGQLIPATSNRVLRCLALRTQTAGADAFPIAPAQIDNGDEALYADKSGTYTKGVLQSGIGLVDLAAYQSFKNALSSGAPADFENIVLGGPRTLNGPQGGLAFHLGVRTPVRSPYRLRPRWRARPTRRNSWSYTGLRCCGMSLSPTIQRIPPQKRRRRS